MSGSEHPLIAAHGADAGAHLICESLEAEIAVRTREGARNPGLSVRSPSERRGSAGLPLRTGGAGDRRNRSNGMSPRACYSRFAGEMKPVNRIQEEESPDLFIQTAARVTELFEGPALFQQLIEGRLLAECVQGLITDAPASSAVMIAVSALIACPSGGAGVHGAEGVPSALRGRRPGLSRSAPEPAAHSAIRT